MQRLVLKNALIVTSERIGAGTVIVEGDRIRCVVYDSGAADGVAGYVPPDCKSPATTAGTTVMDLGGKILMAGGVDAHVHFREPGLTAKADIQTESRSAVCGGVTSFIDMPNTRPSTTTLPLLEEKAALASGRAYANYGFHLGATNENITDLEEAVKNHSESFGGVKVFMGSSTGNMLVNDEETLRRIFSIRGKRILVHCEDESIIRENLRKAAQSVAREYKSTGTSQDAAAIPISRHPMIRSREACIKSTEKALELALAEGTALHVLHVSTAEEVGIIAGAKKKNPNITAETSINYLWFCDEDYAKLGARLKCNPAIKTASDRAGLIDALRSADIDTIGSDHAPHLESEKNGSYTNVPSGIPSIQQTLPVLLTVARRENIPLTRIAHAFSERPAELFGLEDRGKIREGNYADLVIIDPNRKWTVNKQTLQGKCRWTPYEGVELEGAVDTVILNGKIVVLGGEIVGSPAGKRLKFK